MQNVIPLSSRHNGAAFLAGGDVSSGGLFMVTYI